MDVMIFVIEDIRKGDYSLKIAHDLNHDHWFIKEICQREIQPEMKKILSVLPIKPQISLNMVWTSFKNLNVSIDYIH